MRLSLEQFRVKNPWIQAMRLKTLPAAVIPVLFGLALAFHDGVLREVPAVLCLLFALLVQVGTNFANDLFDFEKGADTDERVGPARAVASGLISTEEMRRATHLVFGGAFIVGCGLIPFGGWWLLGIGVLSILCGYAYTGGPYPLGYLGLGDIFVFLFFGIVAVNFTYFVNAGSFSESALWLSLAAGALTTNILVINNCRDIETDVKANKKTLAVRFGLTFSHIQYALLVFLAMVVPLALYAKEHHEVGALLPLLTFPLALNLIISLVSAETGEVYNSLLGRTAQYLVIYGVLQVLGLTVFL